MAPCLDDTWKRPYLKDATWIEKDLYVMSLNVDYMDSVTYGNMCDVLVLAVSATTCLHRY